MPTEYPNRRDKAIKLDWWTSGCLLGAFLLFVATGIGYVDGQIDAQKQADVKAYLETGINQPLSSGY